jgi:hypothetical protein
MPTPIRFFVRRPDVALLLTEASRRLPREFYATLLRELLAAAARLDTGSATETELPLSDEDARKFREWLERAEQRASRAGNHPCLVASRWWWFATNPARRALPVWLSWKGSLRPPCARLRKSPCFVMIAYEWHTVHVGRRTTPGTRHDLIPSGARAIRGGSQVRRHVPRAWRPGADARGRLEAEARRRDRVP